LSPPKAGKGTGMVFKAAELAEKHGWFLCHQFETDANWKIHETTTGPEIVNDLGGKLDYWVTGYGTGGTFHGAGKYIKANTNAKVVLMLEAPLVSSKHRRVSPTKKSNESSISLVLLQSTRFSYRED
jgi:cysteine synthase